MDERKLLYIVAVFVVVALVPPASESLVQVADPIVAPERAAMPLA